MVTLFGNQGIYILNQSDRSQLHFEKKQNKNQLYFSFNKSRGKDAQLGW